MISGVNNCDLSGLLLILLSVNLNISRKLKKYQSAVFQNIDKNILDAFRRYIAAIVWDTVLAQKTVHDAYNFF